MKETDPWIDSTGDASNLKVWISTITLDGGAVIRPTRTGVTVIVGPNNAGKSTLLDQINQVNVGNRYELLTPPLVKDVRLEKNGSRNDLIAWLHEHARWRPGGPNVGAGFTRLSEILHDDEISGWDQSDSISGTFWTRYFSADGYGGNFESGRLEIGTSPIEPLQVLYQRPSVMKELDDIFFKVFGQHLTLDEESPTLRLLLGTPQISPPARGEEKDQYHNSLSELPKLQSQGHGMRSWMSMITPLITGTYPIILADEPEVFLHPPQAFSLGVQLSRLAQRRNAQVLVATHDRHLLAGLLGERAPLSVVRLVRTPSKTHAYSLADEQVRSLWSDPMLRYSNVLDGLFHQAVVLAESDGDCTFYRAALDHYAAKRQLDKPDTPHSEIPAGDIMFLPVSGKDALPKVARALLAVRTPVVVSPDFDILNPSQTTLQNLVISMGGSWPELADLLKKATNSLTQPSQPLYARHVREMVNSLFDKILDQQPAAVWNKEVKDQISPALAAPPGPSKNLKTLGEAYAHGAELTDLKKLLQELLSIGIVPARVGELEQFDPECSQSTKPKWLREAMTKGSYGHQKAQDHVELLIQAIRLASASPPLGRESQ